MRPNQPTITGTAIRLAYAGALALLMARGATAQTAVLTTLYNFQGATDGSSPAGVIAGKNGELFGVTEFGGAHPCGYGSPGCGTVFELTPAASGAWSKREIFNFNGIDGGHPGFNPVFGQDGALYGTTLHGGVHHVGLLTGTVFKLAPPDENAGGDWTETVLYTFPETYTLQTSPAGALFIGPSGAIYGPAFNNGYTPIDGAPDGGVVFELTPPGMAGNRWTDRIILKFPARKSLGLGPQAAVVAVGQSLYGTTTYDHYSDYNFSGCGAVYELSPPAVAGGIWIGGTIYDFKGGDDGCNSVAPLTEGPGVFYGTTNFGGGGACAVYSSEGCGTVFQLTAPATPGGAWTETVIYSFTALNDDGAYPTAGLVLGKNGVLYGTTSYGGSAATGLGCYYWGATGCGTVFQLTPPPTQGGAWTETILHSFTGENGDGAGPGQLVLGPAGILYGTTSSGGSSGYGIVFAVTP
ncbi:MAG: choice-of-anchor tandem repeat GloVer-containing protein [Bryobacteraceae bacterium]|jgi:uncharacterized repeat protein (TIGR03803 family)